MRILPFFVGAMLLASSGAASAQSKVWQADLEDGTFQNPVLFADYSDPDVIRVGDDYYMTSSSFNCVPGLPILHSKDLINWEIVNYALRDLNLEGVVPANFFDTAQHGRGVWAPCLRYHKGEFMIYWGDPDHGIYVVKSRDVKGRWDEPILVLPGKGRIDPSPLFDEDGRVYLAHAWAASRSNTNSIITLCELNSEGTAPISEESLVYDGLPDGNHTTEGGKFYKIDGYYYLLAPAGGVEPGWQIALRSKSVYGPYEMKKVLHQGKSPINGPHQGGLVETQTGEWWFLHFQDKGAYGRIVHAQPVTWKDGWPVMGVKAKNYCGEPALHYTKPNVGGTYPVRTPQESDEFNSPKLGLQWSWHANPQPTWCYPSALGYMRMYGEYLPADYSNFWNIPNLLMQKFPAEEFSATMKAKFVLRHEGDEAGLIVMGWDYARLTLSKEEAGYTLRLMECVDAEKLRPEVCADSVVLQKLPIKECYNRHLQFEEVEMQLRVEVTANAMCQFSYSIDGKRFSPLGEPFKARAGKWIGAKMGMYVLSTSQTTHRSWIDVDWFRVE